jgi:hypothetical protein
MLTRIAVTVLVLVSYTGAALAASKAVVYKDPYCGCCEGYIAHLRAHGIDAVARNTDRVEVVKKMRGVPEDLWSPRSSAC